MFDFTLSNPIIGKYFKGESNSPPIAEFLYVDTHPLIRPNFLTELEELSKTACARLQVGDIPQDSFLPLLTKHAVILGTSIESPEEKAVTILESLKDLYTFFTQVIKNESK